MSLGEGHYAVRLAVSQGTGGDREDVRLRFSAEDRGRFERYLDYSQDLLELDALRHFQ